MQNSVINQGKSIIPTDKAMLKMPYFVLGASVDGNVEWKTDDGKTLKDIVNYEVSEE